MTNEGATMNIPEEIVEKAAEALTQAYWGEMYTTTSREIDAARAALTAAAPLLMAQALREAVGEFECHVGVGEFADQTIRDGIPWGHIEEAWQHQGAFMAWLLNRADELEQS